MKKNEEENIIKIKKEKRKIIFRNAKNFNYIFKRYFYFLFIINSFIDSIYSSYNIKITLLSSSYPPYASTIEDFIKNKIDVASDFMHNTQLISNSLKIFSPASVKKHKS